MPIMTKPDEQIFASAAKQGEVNAFPNLSRGWGITFDETGGIPPMEWFNALFKRIDEKDLYQLQRGLPEWSATLDYPARAYVQHQGQTYRSLREHRNQSPSVVNSTYWERWGFALTEIARATLTQAGIVQLTNDTGLDSEALALSAKAGKKLSQEIAQNRQKTVDLANQKVNKSDVSDAVNSTSQTTVASSRAVKTAFDKGVEAKTAADNARTFAAEKTTELEEKKQDKLVEQIISLTELDPNKWYPVILKMPNVRKSYLFAIRHTLGDGNNPSWGTHEQGFTAYCEWVTQPSGWGVYAQYAQMRDIRHFTFSYCEQSPILSIGQVYQVSYEYFYLRGGTSYTLYREDEVGVEIGRNGYEWRHSHLNNYRGQLPIISVYDANLVPKTTRQALQELINAKADRATTLAGYHISDFNVATYRGDLNTIRIDGFYSINSVSEAQNLPAQSSGHLIVISGGVSNQRWCRQLFKKHYSGETFERWQISSQSDEWSDWVRTDGVEWRDIRNKPAVTRRDYSRTVNGTSPTWDGGTSKSIQVTGFVEIYPDGKVVQHFYFHNFRIMWFELEAARGSHGRIPEIPLQLWTAMPNKITFASGYFSRFGDGGVTVGAEAAEWLHPIWAFEKQANIKDRCYLYARRFTGDTNESVDMYIKVEGY